SKKSTLMPISSKISEVPSITKDQVYVCSWKKRINEISPSWLSCTKIDCVDSPSISWNLSSNFKESQSKLFHLTKTQIEEKSILNKNWQQISSQLLLTSHQKIMLKEALKINKEEINSVKIFRIYPTILQKKFYNRCFGTNRFIWNQVLNFIEKFKSENNFKYPDLKTIRDELISANSRLLKENTWLGEYPYDFRDIPMQNVLASYKSNDAKIRNKLKEGKNNITKYKIK